MWDVFTSVMFYCVILGKTLPLIWTVQCYSVEGSVIVGWDLALPSQPVFAAFWGTVLRTGKSHRPVLQAGKAVRSHRRRVAGAETPSPAAELCSLFLTPAPSRSLPGADTPARGWALRVRSVPAACGAWATIAWAPRFHRAQKTPVPVARVTCRSRPLIPKEVRLFHTNGCFFQSS